MGSRLLSDWVNNPLIDPEEIETRLQSVAELVERESLATDVRELLRKVYDLERLLTRVATGRANPRDLNFIGRSLRNLPEFKQMLSSCQSRLLKVLHENIDPCDSLSEELEKALIEDCPLTSREGGFIRQGYHEELDACRELQQGGKEWIAQYQAKEMERTGIAKLKVGFNRVFGYYLEVTNVHREKIPENYHRKQTLKNAERYITPELKEYEERVLTADEKACALEYDLFIVLREKVAKARPAMHRSAMAIAHLDALCSLATLARRRNYCRPTIVAESVLSIEKGRHPVLDILEPEGAFVPNDTDMGNDSERIHLITGPNMAGKSTYIRQTALICLMAQIGSFVPASKATIGVADRIFARVGASDELARGQSTFMVEMTETARILNMATSRSLVILDEIGRGTSTYDGISLAWAVVEHLHDHLGCRTLFATHYHELTELAHSFERIENYNVAVREWNDDVVFLHKIVPGSADKSYGIHVARLAGVPRAVVERAKEILTDLEEAMLESDGKVKIVRSEPREKGTEIQLTLFGPADHPMIDETRTLDLEKMSPMEAMNWLHQWQQELKKETPGGGKRKKKR
jgi:DNA mismatch repair protein MutS